MPRVLIRRVKSERKSLGVTYVNSRSFAMQLRCVETRLSQVEKRTYETGGINGATEAANYVMWVCTY